MHEIIKINFGNNQLSDLFDSVTNIKRDVGSGWSNNSVAQKEGVSIISTSRGAKQISFDYMLKGTMFDELNSNKQTLASYINVNEPTALIFDDEPNKVWYAVPDGEQSFTIDNRSGSITFLVPDGHAYSSYSNVLNLSNSGGINGSITPNSDGSVDVTINNQGSLPAWINLTLTNNHENGYFGIAGVNGALEIGKREEVDGVVLHNSEILYDSDNDNQFSKLVDVKGKPNPQVASIGGVCDTNGQLGYRTVTNNWQGQTITTTGLKVTDFGSATAGLRGGMKCLTLPADSNGQLGSVNFYAWMRFLEWAGANGQTGVTQVMFTDANDVFLAGYGIVKIDMTGNKGAAKFWVGGNNPREWQSMPFTMNNGENTKDPENNVMFNNRTGSADFFKKGGAFSFYWRNSRKTIQIPELANSAIAKVYFFIGDWIGNKNGMVSNMQLRRFWCRKDNVQKWDDLPNRYKQGSAISVTMADGGVSIDGISSITETVTGTEPFSIPPGISKLKIIQSSWNTTPPDVQITWQERIL
ncbi:phage tail protein [Lactococcus hircilactis]|uniref:Phage tail protein n=1 Tax=Lactococcus hircilactis TaxID=1494462 RepID=A0A7X2D2X2_9LACT|nr:distal tail protein Dit [Lactococcus hircilactis]MQW40555.1 phage tail protein [Lactococcus hircilactis]